MNKKTPKKTHPSWCVSVTHLFHDRSGALDKLSFGEAVRRAQLQSSGFLDHVDAAVPQLLHPGLDLKANLKAQAGFDLQPIT